jgi:hypothetical protein
MIRRFRSWAVSSGEMMSQKYIHYLVEVKVKFTLEQATKAKRGSRGIALLFL